MLNTLIFSLAGSGGGGLASGGTSVSVRLALCVTVVGYIGVVGR